MAGNEFEAYDKQNKRLRVGDRVEDAHDHNYTGVVQSFISEEEQNPAWHVGEVVVKWDREDEPETAYGHMLVRPRQHGRHLPDANIHERNRACFQTMNGLHIFIDVEQPKNGFKYQCSECGYKTRRYQEVQRTSISEASS